MRKSAFIAQLLSLVAILINCKSTPIEADCSSANINETEAYEISVGSWSLVSIKSGWSSEINKPLNPTMLVVKNSQQAVISENGNEVVRFHFTLRKSGDIFFYEASNRSDNSVLIPPSGKFRVCNKQLIIDATDIDGPRYIYERI